jgi:hypothetical protein
MSVFNVKYNFKKNLKALRKKLYKELIEPKLRKQRSRDFMDNIFKEIIAKELFNKL